MTHAVPSDEADPLIAINTTPLIDVMLVLLIMFIITIPVQTHAVKLDVSSGRPPVVQPDPLRNRLVITEGGALLWNGRVLSRDELARTLRAVGRMEPQPEVHFQPEAGARYELVDEVLAISKRAGVERMGFVGNERYRQF